MSVSFTPDDLVAPQPPAGGQALSLDEAPKPDSQLLTVATPPVPLSDKAVTRQAQEADFGLGANSPGLDVLKSGISTGMDGFLRESAARRQALEEQGHRVEMVKELARNQKGPVTPEQADQIMRIGSTTPNVDPSIVWESAFSRGIINSLLFAGRESVDVIGSAFGFNSNKAFDMTDAAQDIITKKRINQGVREELDAYKADKSFGGKAVDFLEGFIPVKAWWQLKDAAGASKLEGLPNAYGSTLSDVVQNLAVLPPAEYKARVKEITNYLMQRNIFDAERFVDALDSYTSDSKFIDNAFSAFDIATLVPAGLIGKGARRLIQGKEVLSAGEVAGKALAEGSGPLERFGNYLKNAVQGASSKTGAVTAEDMLTATGDLKKAAEVRVFKDASAELNVIAHDPVGASKGLIDRMPTWFNPSALMSNSNLGAEAVRRLTTVMEENAGTLVQALTKSNTIDRLTPEALRVAFDEAWAVVKARYNHVNDAVLDVKPVVAREIRPEDNPIVNTGAVQVILGKTDGTLFESEFDALKWAHDFYKLEGDVKAVQHGTGWGLEITKYLDETTPKVREALLISTKNRKDDGGIFGSLFRGLRTADDSVPEFQRQNRKVLITGLNNIEKAAQEVAQSIKDLGKEGRNRLREMMAANRDAVITLPNGEKKFGMWHESAGGYEIAYKNKYGSFPSEKEVEAYFAMRQLYDFDYVTRNATIFRDKARQGIENISLRHKMLDAKGREFTTDFEINGGGKFVDNLPWNQRDWSVYIHTNDPNMPGEIYRAGADILGEQRKLIDEMLANGYKIVQVVNPNWYPMEKVVGRREPVNYIITADAVRNPMDWVQIPYQGGGHKSYQTQWMVKQPKINRTYDTQGPTEAPPAVAIIPQEFTTTDTGVKTKAFVYNNRIITIVDINGEKVPFYISTGSGGKQSVKTGKWYPFFGNGPEDGWFNKGTEAEINSYYGSRKLRAAAEKLDNELGDLRSKKDDLPRGFNKGSSSPHWVKQHYVDTTGMFDHLNPVNHKDSANAPFREFVNRLEGNPKAPDSPLPKAAPPEAPKPTGHTFEGDTSIMGFNTEAEAKKYAALMDQARVLYRDNKINELKPFLEKNLPFTYDEFKKLFVGYVDEAGKEHPAKLHKDDPISHVFTGERTSDKIDYAQQYSNFTDNIRSPHNLWANLDKEYAGQKNEDLWTVDEKTPIFQLGTAEKIDPLQTLNDSVANVMRNRYMQDYKISAVETWIQEFGDLIKGADKDLMRANPVYYLHNGIIDKSNPDYARVSLAEAQRTAILNLLGTKSDSNSWVEWVERKLADALYESKGQAASNKLTSSSIFKQADPFKYAREVAFYSKLALYNPVQLFLQAQTLTHVIGLAGPANGIAGTAAGTFMSFLRYTEKPNIIDWYAQKAAAFGMKPSWFKESYEEMQRLGLWHVAGETAWRSGTLDPNVVTSGIRKHLDRSAIFFNEGERLTRMAAWNAAYLEWRKANPSAVIDNQVRRQLADRTNMMTVNMMRDANASWQQGIWSVPTQFLGYQARLSEQLLGNRITNTEKARLMAAYSLMYGLPAGTAAFLGGVPFSPDSSDIRQKVLENGGKIWGMPVDNTVGDFLLNGAASTAIHVLTGADFNVSERYGPNNMWKELLKDDKGLFGILFGASGSIIEDFAKTADPFAKSILNAFSSDSGNQYAPQAEDFLAFANNISSVSQATKTIWALNTGLYFSKNGVRLSEISPWSAIFTGMTGLSPREVSDTNLMLKSMKEVKDAQAETQKYINTYMSRAVNAMNNNDYAKYEEYMRLINMHFIAGGFQDKDRASVYQKASAGILNLNEKAKMDFWKNAPKPQQQDRMNKQFNLEQ